MAEYNRWDVWEADVPFEDINRSKKRPVVILSEKEALVLSLKMTSHEPRYNKLEGEYELMKWQEAGLLKPTVVQCSKVLKLSKDAITDKKYGRLSATDIIGLSQLLKYMRVAV